VANLTKQIEQLKKENALSASQLEQLEQACKQMLD
jgi:hypothetical protein